MRKVSLVVVLIAAASCSKKKKDEPAGPPPPPPVAIDAAAPAVPLDAAAPPIDAGDPEAALRQGKATGLGAPGEVPQVVTEALIAAIAEGKLPADRFVDPAAGYLEHTIMPGATDKAVPDVKKRHCGAKAAAALLADAKTLVRVQGAGTDPDVDDHVLQCGNQYLTTDDPHFGGSYDSATDTTTGGAPWKYAVCNSGGAGEYDANYVLYFAPDATRGVRVVGMLTWEGGMNPDAVYAEYAAAAMKPGTCKP